MNRIRMLREEKGVKQIDLAMELNVTQGTLSNWERGVHDPDSDSLRKLSNYFSVPIDYILGGGVASYNNAENKKQRPVYDDEALELMEEMHKRPELKVLFSTSKNATKEDIEFVDEMLKRMAGKNNDT